MIQAVQGCSSNLLYLVLSFPGFLSYRLLPQLKIPKLK
jgi:hypothetical protein